MKLAYFVVLIFFFTYRASVNGLKCFQCSGHEGDCGTGQGALKDCASRDKNTVCFIDQRAGNYWRGCTGANYGESCSSESKYETSCRCKWNGCNEDKCRCSKHGTPLRDGDCEGPSCDYDDDNEDADGSKKNGSGSGMKTGACLITLLAILAYQIIQ